MASFCGTCGTPTGGAKFCPKCGSPQTITGQAAYTPAKTARAKSGFPALKAVFIILAAMILLGIAGVVGALYWAKGRVEEIAHSSGAANLRDGATRWREAVSSAAHAQPTEAGCKLLDKQRVSGLLGSTVARAEGNDAGDLKEYCNYWSNESDSNGDSKKAIEEHPASSRDGAATLDDLQDLAKNISIADNAHKPLLAVQVFRGTAKVALLSLKTASLFAGQKQRSIDGPWDEAYFGPFDALLFVRKGDNGLMLDLHHVSQSREKALALARAMVGDI
jgi:hypothetical protein